MISISFNEFFTKIFGQNNFTYTFAIPNLVLSIR